MAPRVVVEDVAAAMDRGDEEPFEPLLDLRTGAIEHVPDRRVHGRDVPEALARALEAQPDRFLLVPRIDGREQFLWMSEFASSVEDDDVRDRLGLALAGRGAFARFRVVLSEHRDLRDAWSAERGARFVVAAEAWLRGLPADLALTRRPELEPTRPARAATARRPATPTFAQVLLLGAAEPAEAAGTTRRVFVAPSQPRAHFRAIVRDFCASRGVGWRNRFVDGVERFEHEDTTIRLDGARVVIDVVVPPAVEAMFRA